MTVARLRGGGFLIAAVVASSLIPVGVGRLHMSAAWAAPGFRPTTKVVLFTPAYSDPLVARLEAELEAVGIIVRRIDMPPDLQLDAVITHEIASGASAAIRVIPRSRGTEVWTGDTTARVLRRRSIRADTSDAALSVIALRTVEFLRASLLDVRLGGASDSGGAKGTSGSNNTSDQPANRETAAPVRLAPNERVTPGDKAGSTTVQTETFTSAPRQTAPSEAPAATPAAVSQAPRPNPRATPASAETTGVPPATSRPLPDAKPVLETRGTSQPSAASSPFEITAGPAFLASPGGIAPVISAATMGRVRITERSGIEIMAVFPIVPRRVPTPEGSVQVSAALFGIAADFRLASAGSWVADGGVGASALMFRAVGSAAGAPGGVSNRGRTELAWKLATHVRFGLGKEINRWLAIRVDAIAGFTPGSRIKVEYPDTPETSVTRATWGPVFGAGALSVQAAW